MDPLPSRFVPISVTQPRRWPTHVARLSRLVRKELSEILRDRRTILTLVLMPVLIYPLLAIAFQQHFLASTLALRKQPAYVIGLPSEQESLIFQSQLELGDNVYRQRNPDKPKQALTIEPVLSTDIERDVKDGRIHLGLRGLPRRGKVGQDEVVVFEAVYKESLGAAQEVLEHIERRLAMANEFFLRSRLNVPGRPPVRLFRLRLVPKTYEAPQRVSLGALIPLILILMTITGAVYPAIDLTAGERERGTMEILVAAPVPRLGLLFGKYVTVFTVAVITALVNLLTMLVTLISSGMGALVFAAGDISFLVIIEILGLLLLFAAFFSAALLAITSAARSFKEAQAYIIPLMLLSLTPGVMGMLPGLKLEGSVRVIPLLNIVLLARDLFEGQATAAAASVVVVSTLLYSIAILAVAARIFGAESVLFSEQRSWSDLWRRPPEPSANSTLANALLCLALVFPTFFVLQGSLIREMSILGRLLAMPLGSALLFGLFPIIFAWWNRVTWRSGFQLRRPGIGGACGGVLLGLSLWTLVLQGLALWTLFVIPKHGTPLPEEHAQLLQAFRDARNQHLPILLLAVVFQAIAEEWFFRGYLFAALRSNSGPWLTIGGSALLFGFFHLVSAGGLAFLSSTILGAILGWIAWRTSSVVPGMFLHAIHNVILGGVLTGVNTGVQDLLPWTWVALGAVVVAAGIALVQLGSTPRSAEAELHPE
ncbi:MAG: CPBP family intramembrane metalloprotease [Planctomycetes bacterium]|nr:CPBP family intramembrane metalloprotease [Planctomycetota bacterium]